MVAPRDDNRVTALLGQSIDDNTAQPIWMDPNTGRLYVNSILTDGTTVAQIVNDKEDTGNSTEDLLLADATFTGTSVDTFGYSGYSITIEVDVAGTLTVEYSDDNDHWHQGEIYVLPQNVFKPITPPLWGRYLRLIYVNGGENQTDFHMHSYLRKRPFKWSSHNINDNLNDDDDAELVASVVKLRRSDGTYTSAASTTTGNFKVSLEEFENAVSSNSNTQLNVTQYLSDGVEGTKITDGDNSVSVDGLGSLKIYEPTSIVGASFEGTTVDPNFWTSTVTNGGTVTQDGQILIATNTTANGTARLDSVLKARKIPGTLNEFRGVGHLETAPQTNNYRTIGCYDNSNGAFFKIDGTTFKLVTRSGGVDTEVTSGNFNGHVTSITPDTDIHRWAIDYSAFSVKFIYDGVLIHTVLSTTDPWTKSLTLPIRLESVNSNGNTTNNQLHFQLLTILRLGRLQTGPRSRYQSGITTGRVLKYGEGELRRAIISGVAQNSVITFYDNTAASGTMLWSSGAMSAQTQPFSLDFGDLPFVNGLTLVISGASSNITVNYE